LSPSPQADSLRDQKNVISSLTKLGADSDSTSFCELRLQNWLNIHMQKQSSLVSLPGDLFANINDDEGLDDIVCPEYVEDF
jgi:hypothetical protein